MFDEDVFKQNVNKLTKHLLIRLALIIISFGLIWVFRTGLWISLILLVLPLLLYQIYVDKRIVIPKLVVIFAWTLAFFVTSWFASYWGAVGLALFYLIYFGYRFLRVRKDPSFQYGLWLIRNAGELGQEQSKSKENDERLEEGDLNYGKNN